MGKLLKVLGQKNEYGKLLKELVTTHQHTYTE